MKRIWTGLCLGSLCLISLASFADRAVDQLINKISPNVNLGMIVVDLTSGETLYQRNANRLFIPASNMKLFSEAAALMALGPDYRFKNQLSVSQGQIQDGVLKGNLYLHLSGDPSFSHKELSHLLASLKDWHIKSIQGNVIIDSALAGVDAYPPGWLTSDLSFSYGAPIAPLMLDTNRLSVIINPGSHNGAQAIVELDNVDKNSGAIVINNQATTKTNPKGCSLGLGLNQDNQLEVRGCIGIGQWAVQQRLAIKNPLVYAQGMIKAQLAKADIQLQGQVQLGKAPSGTLLLATEYSQPLSQLMADTLKPSDNLYADSLYLHAAAQLNGASVNWPEAQPVMKKFMQEQTGIDFSNAVFTDGSGLSRYNLVTPIQTISLLKYLHDHFPLSYEYIAALPISGRDGTLQKRFREPSQQGFVRAKTGYMTGVNSLSGYLYTANGHTLAFAMHINKNPEGKQTGPGRPLLDALTSYFLKQSPGGRRPAQVSEAHDRVQFQSKPTQEQVQQNQQAKWRRLESTVKLALKGQAVTVLYRDNELIIEDNQADPNRVWAALQSVNKKYPFAVALSSGQLRLTPKDGLVLVWRQEASGEGKRTWMIREAVKG